MENYDADKARQLILYIAKHSDVGRMKLMKLLYFIDFSAYTQLGRSITGDTYSHWDHGPVPINIFGKLRNMEGLNFSQEDRGMPRPYTKINAEAEPNQATLSDDEWNVIKRVLGELGGHDGNTLARMAKKELTLRLIQQQETIPYALAAYRNHKPLSAQEIKTLADNETYMGVIRAKVQAFKRSAAA